MVLIVALAVATVVAGAAVAWRSRATHAPDPTEVHLGTQTAQHAVAEHPSFRRLLRRRVDPTKATGLALTVAASLAVLGALVVGTVLEMVQRHAGLASLDDSAARFGVHHRTPFGERLLSWLTQLGSTKVIIPLALVIAIAEHRRRPTRQVVPFLAVAIGGTLAINNLVKALVGRARPDIARVVGAAGSSFPSGHSSNAAVTYAALALVLGRGRSHRVKAALASTAAMVATAVATSRVLLGVHWLTDVVAGLGLGWGWFAVSSIVFGGRLLQFGRPVAKLEEQAARSVGAAPG